MKTDGTRWLRLNVATDNKCTQMTSISDFNDYISPLVYCGWGKGGRRERERERGRVRKGGEKREKKKMNATRKNCTVIDFEILHTRHREP